MPTCDCVQVTTQYRGPNDGNLVRRLDFPEHWCFECACPRCSDPTELGTMVSAVRCASCRAPSVLPLDSLDHHSPWSCRACGNQVGVDKIKDIIDQLDEDFRFGSSHHLTC